MARCSCGSECGCNLVAGTNTTVTGSGTPANPWTVSALTNCDQVRDCLSDGNGISYNDTTGVISACLSTDANNNIVFGTDGCLFVPTGAATVTPGCGLTGNGAAATPIQVNVQPWPYPCDVTAAAGGAYCDANGELRTEPPNRAAFVQSSLGQSFPGNPLIPAGEPDQTIASLDLTITNPDTCRPALVILFQEADVDLNLPPGSEGGYGIDTDDMVHLANYGDTLITREHVQVDKLINLTLAAGASTTYTMNVTANRGAGGAFYTRVQATLRAWVFTDA